MTADPSRIGAFGQQPAIGIDRVVERGRKRMLGRKPVVDAKHARLRVAAAIRQMKSR